MIILDFTGLLLLKNRLNSVYAKASYLWIGILSDKSAFSLVIVMLRDKIVMSKIINPWGFCCQDELHLEGESVDSEIF